MYTPDSNAHALSAHTLLQLGRRIREAPTKEVLGFIAVNESRQLFEYRQAALVQDSTLLAVSGLPKLNLHAPYIQWLTEVFRVLPSTHSNSTTALPICAQDLPEHLKTRWSEWLPECGLLLPLRTANESHTHPAPLAYLLLARDYPWESEEIEFGEELAALYGYALARFQPKISWKTRLRIFQTWKKNKWKWIAAGLFIISFPVRLSVIIPAEVTPQNPFPVRAPLEGVIDHIYVHPNQAVKAGDPLFDLDTTTLRARLSVARKSVDVATEAYRQAIQMALNDEKNKSDIAFKKGQLDEKTLDLDYSQALLERIQIKAPKNGVIIFSDVNDWQGRALSIGERVMTLADPNKIELSLSLPISDLITLNPHAPVTLYPNGTLFTSYSGQLTQVGYHADPLPSGILAYPLKATLNIQDTPPRIGLMGTASVKGNWVPLIYTLMRRPLAATRQWLGW